MTQAIIIFISLMALVVSYKLFEQAAGTLSPMKLHTISYVFYVQIVAMAFVGSVIIACGFADWHPLVQLVTNKTKIYAWMGMMYSMIAMPAAMIVLNRSLKVNMRQRFDDYIRKPVEFRQGPVLSLVLLCVFTGISALTLLYVVWKSPSLPIMSVLLGNMEEAARQRVEVRRNFGGLVYIRTLLGYLMIPTIAYYSAVYALLRRRIIYYALFAFNTLLALTLLVFDTQKAPIVLFLFGFIILYTLMRGGVSRRLLIMTGAGGLLLIAGAYSLTAGLDMFKQLSNPGSALYGRLFITEYAGYLLSIELFPDVITEPTWQIGLPSFVLNLFGLSNVESARLLMMYVNPKGVISGEANLVSSYYLAEAWANYGWAGLLIAPFIVGVIVQVVHIFLIQSRKEPLIIAFYSFMTVRWVLSSGFVNFLYLKIIIFPLIFFVFYKAIINSLSNIKPRQ